MVSTRNLAAAAVLVAVAAGLTGCTSPSQAARDLALSGLSAQLQTLGSNASDITGASGPTEISAQIKAGKLGAFFTDPIPSTTPVPAPVADAIYGVTASDRGARFDAVVWASGESGGGFTGDQASVYVCVSGITGQAVAATKSTFREVACRKDVAALMRDAQGKVLVKLSDVPAPS